MARKAKHHYVPKCYLKGFTDGGENSSPFWAIPINNGSPFSTSPNDACAQRDYYTVDHKNPLVVEDFYAEKIEPNISEALRYIKKNSCLPPQEEMRNLILLLATLYLRVPSHREALVKPFRRMKEIVESMNHAITICNKSSLDYSKSDLIMQEIRLIDVVQECLSKMYYQLYIVEDEKHNVITSDNPFMMWHTKGCRGIHFGLNTSNVLICVPITSKAILLARNEKVIEGEFLATKEMIAMTNTKIMWSASRFYYSKTEEILLLDNDANAYKHNINTNN